MECGIRLSSIMLKFASKVVNYYCIVPLLIIFSASSDGINFYDVMNIKLWLSTEKEKAAT